MRQKYFIQPFGNAGDITPAIPDAADATGLVSYSAGWTFDYQRLLGTDSAAKEILRVTLNAAFNDVTTVLQALQQQGVPEFITAAQNGGTAFPYRLRALVAYSANGAPPFSVYMNLVDNNTAVPGSGSNSWVLVKPEDYPLLDGNNTFTGSNGFSISPTVPAGTTGNQAVNFTQLSAEATARANADSTLQNNINAEANTRNTNDIALSTAISAEAATRNDYDVNLQTQIAGEASTRNTNDIALSTAISTEATNRYTQDVALQNEINSLAAFTTIRDVTGSRVFNTAYANTTGRPMFVMMFGTTQGPNASLQFISNGVQIMVFGQPATATATIMFGIVPPGTAYGINNTVNGVTIQGWMELY